MGQWTVEVDEERNRLYLELSGVFEAGDAAEAAEATLSAAERLDADVEMIDDISELQIGDQDAAARLETVKERLSEQGLTTAVRVRPAATATEAQFAEAGEDVEDYEVRTVDTVAAAEDALD
jgi:hypothetical protein